MYQATNRFPCLGITPGSFLIIERPWKGHLFDFAYYWKLFNHVWQLYTLGMGKFFHMQGHMIKK